jgi:predicted MPP superfamily phosphohydrolase
MKHLVIPDCQVKPGQSVEYLSWIGQYASEKKPDVIVCIGDFADMPSLSSYDIGKKSFEGRTYKADIKAAHKGMDALMGPIVAEQERLIRNKDKRWTPRLVLTLGNHEHRIDRAVEYDRKLEGLISTSDLKYEDYGWEVYPFLEVVVIGGIAYSHYFTSGVMGRPVTSAQMLVTKKHMSCFAGHQQGRQIAYARRADGKEMTAIIAGSCYEHNEDYLGPQGNEHWRGFYMLHEVNDGAFDEMAVSINYLKATYGA